MDPTRKLWTFSNVVHIIKCIRNYFKDKNIVNYDEQPVNYDFYRRIFEIDTSPEFAGVRICPKLMLTHLHSNSFKRMNARLAFQIFSNSVANGIKFCQEMGTKGFEESEHTENFNKDLNDKADAMNSKVPLKSLYKVSKISSNINKILTAS